MSKAVNRAIYSFHRKLRELNPTPLPKPERQRLARSARDKYGMELTPDQADATLRRALERIRAFMVEHGHMEFAAMEDDELREMVREAHIY